MTPGDAWLVAFAGLVLVSAVTVLVRPEPTLLRGGTALGFVALYVAFAWAVLALRGDAIPPRAIIAAVAALVVTGLMAPWWFVLGGHRAGVISTIEVCFGRVCAEYQRTGSGFVMSIPGGDLHVGLHALASRRLTVISLRARPSHAKHKKGDLFRRLLVKQYRGVLPVIRIRMG